MIERLAATPGRIRALIARVCEEELSRRPSEDAFSLRENILHLRDIDVEGYEKRVILMLTTESAFLPDVDGAKLAVERDYNHQAVSPALEAFEQSRTRSIARLQGADLTRTAEFEGVGPVTLGRLLELWMEHDAGHLAYIEAILAGRAARRVGDAA
jgi:hypothetical protein